MDGISVGLVCLVVLLILILWYGFQINKHFAKFNINSAKNAIPYLGNMKSVFLGQKHLSQLVHQVFEDHPNDKYIGFYAFNTPSILIKDVELVKKITIKDFDHFINHKVFMDEEADPLFGRNLFFLRGQKWRDMRITMSPAYTVSKMKLMLPFIFECGNQLNKYLKDNCQLNMENGKSYFEVEMKDIFSRVSSDVIASTAFGVNINSLLEKNNDFFSMGKRATNFSGIQFFKFFAFSSFPSLMKFLGIPLFPSEVANFFRKLVKDMIESREEKGIIRHDMIHLLMQAKNGTLTYEQDVDAANIDDNNYSVLKDSNIKNPVPKRDWTHDDLTAQAVAFIIAGFDTTSSLLCFTAYELALNQDVQKTLQDEIDEYISNNNNSSSITYVELNKLKYLNMVISESLRMWPPDVQLERVCVKSYELPSQNENSDYKYTINIGDDLWVPIYAIHHDPKNYSNPDKFIPERFSDENKNNIHPQAFIPFGAGPRQCIGARFAVMEAKAIIFKLLSEFDIITTNNTVIPLEITTDTFLLRSKHGYTLGLKLRQHKYTNCS